MQTTHSPTLKDTAAQTPEGLPAKICSDFETCQTCPCEAACRAMAKCVAKMVEPDDGWKIINGVQVHRPNKD
jgi:hypothetical protein